MMGRQGGDQAQLFYSFNLDQHIPSDHLLRNIDRFLDLSDIHQHLMPFYSCDTAYGSGPMLNWIVNEKRIAAHIPVWDKSERIDGTFNRADFQFDAENNRYICPAGKFLKPAWRSKQKNRDRYRAHQDPGQTRKD